MSKTIQKGSQRPTSVTSAQSYRDFMRSISTIDTRARERARLAAIEARADIARSVGA